ncbi:MAG TPA: hypothetical protein VHB25_01775 [Gemmatimonadaceae bacterium]|nr:hypothetical protein [Gemmatimonadaceae bacterium]
MREQPLSSSLVIGGITAAATTGALIAMGRRQGSARLPFAAIGAAFSHQTTSAVDARLVLGGLVLHILAMLVWSVVFVWVTRRLDGRDIVAAILTTMVAFAFSILVTQWRGSGLASVLPIGDLLVLALVFAAALVVGMRFALPELRSA